MVNGLKKTHHRLAGDSAVRIERGCFLVDLAMTEKNGCLAATSRCRALGRFLPSRMKRATIRAACIGVVVWQQMRKGLATGSRSSSSKRLEEESKQKSELPI